MTKRIVELTCGDPKTNQQTASKVECVINVNNHNSAKVPKSQNVVVNDETDCYDTEIEVHSNKHVKGGGKKVMRDIPTTGSVTSLYVSRSIAQEELPQPQSAEGYIQTASRPTISEADIISSNVVKDVLLKAFNNLLTTNDTALMAQLTAAKKLDERKVVLIADDLKELISTCIRRVEPEYKTSETKIKVTVNDVEIGCCGLTKPSTYVQPFNEIVNIVIGNQDLKIHQFELYNTIEEKLGVSLRFCYSITPDKQNNAEIDEAASA